LYYTAPTKRESSLSHLVGGALKKVCKGGRKPAITLHTLDIQKIPKATPPPNHATQIQHARALLLKQGQNSAKL